MSVSLIPNWRYINQLSAPVSEDDGVDENKNQNCVAADVAMCLWSLTGVQYSPDQLKDAVYGEAYTGPQSAAAYVKYCADHGMTLTPTNGQPWDLIEGMKRELESGRPSLFTVPTRWQDNVDTGSTHVMVALGWNGNTSLFDIADPWGGIPRQLSGVYLAPRLRFNQTWQAGASAAAIIASLTKQVADLTAQLAIANARIAAAQRALGG